MPAAAMVPASSIKQIRQRSSPSAHNAHAPLASKASPASKNVQGRKEQSVVARANACFRMNLRNALVSTGGVVPTAQRDALETPTEQCVAVREHATCTTMLQRRSALANGDSAARLAISHVQVSQKPVCRAKAMATVNSTQNLASQRACASQNSWATAAHIAVQSTCIMTWHVAGIIGAHVSKTTLHSLIRLVANASNRSWGKHAKFDVQPSVTKSVEATANAF